MSISTQTTSTQSISTQHKPASLDPDPGSALSNPAVARCVHAATAAFEKSLDKDDNQYRAEKAAKAAFRNAMPPLAGAGRIRDFIACVAHGLLTDLIEGDDASRLLYAAQVAGVAQRRQAAKPHLRPGAKSPSAAPAESAPDPSFKVG